MKKKCKKMNYGGIYQPVGQLIDPQLVREAQALEDRMNSPWMKAAKLTKALAPLAGTLIAGPAGGAVGSGISQGMTAFGLNYGGPITPISRESTNYVNPMMSPVISPMSPLQDMEILMRDGFITKTDAVNSLYPPTYPAHIKSSPKMIKPIEKVRYRNTGGDLPLSSNSFEVKGDPNKVDSEYYPQENVKLDDGEVVTKDQSGAFVFSDTLGFAKLAKKPSQAIGKAEQKLKEMPYDETSKATIAHSQQILNKLAKAQEELATKLGLRENQTRSFNTGGPIPYKGFDVLKFQQFANANGWALKNDNIWGPKTEAVYKRLADAYNRPEDINPYANTNATFGNPISSNFNKTTTELYPGIEELGPVPPTTEFVPEGLPFEGTPMLEGNSPDPTSNMIDYRSPNLNQGQTAQDARYRTPWTTGDYFKVAELASKGIGLLRPSEKERPNYDYSRITKQSYDPSKPLNDTNRQFSNFSNSLQAGSLSTRRAMLSALQGQVLNNRNDILANYANLNNQAQVQYEERLSNQNRYNQQEKSRVNTINSQNRAAKDQAVQNMFTSVGQFGEDLNRKRFAEDQINLMSVMYPDIFPAYLKTMKRK